MMGEIYKFARKVIVWLGPENEYGQAAIDFVKANGSSSRSFASNFSANSTGAAQTHTIVDLIRRDYWHRAWIIQEVFQAGTITIHCGFHILSWTTLAKFFRLVEHQLLISSKNTNPELNEIYHSTAFKLTKDRTSKNRDLQSLLLRYRTSLCSDARDKVFSLCGLSKSYQPLVDYTRSAEELFMSLITHLRGLNNSIWRSENSVRCEVGTAQLAQEVLGLSAPCDRWRDNWGALFIPPGNKLNREVTCKYTHQNLVSGIGPILSTSSRTWWLESKYLDWYRRFTGPSMPSLSRLEEAIRNLTVGDVQRLESFKHPCEVRLDASCSYMPVSSDMESV